MATSSEFAQLSSAAYQNVPANMQLPQGWSFIMESQPDPSGYRGYAFARLDAAGNPIEIVIANRGTEPTSSLDRAADLQMMANQLPDQYQYAKQFYRDVLAVSGDTPIATTGHSLGGTLAQLLAAESTQAGNPLLTAVTFNPYGAKDLIPAINAQYGLSLDPNASYSNITNHQTMLDGVSRLGSSFPVGSGQIGQMQTHTAASELVAAALVIAARGMSPAAFPAAYLAVEFYWSHSIDRFTDEVFPQEALVAQVGHNFTDFVRTLNDQINAIEQAGATAQANLQNDFQQLAGTAGQTYQDTVNSVSAAMEQIAGAMTAAEKSAAKTFLDFAFGLGNTINGIEQTIATLFNSAQTFVQRFGDPLTLDLNGDGIRTVPLKVPPLLFDINASGIKIGTGWIAPDDGLLVLDRNGNGTVDSGAELFGDATPKYDAAGNPTSARTADGFAALAQEDTNADGVVNALDAHFADLKVWQDLNQDGISQPDELTSLADAGIASFDTARTQHSQLLPSGNQMADMGTYTRADGSAGATGAPQGMADINLALDTFHRSFADTIPPTAAARALPDMQGSGKVCDLREAANDAVFEERRLG